MDMSDPMLIKGIGSQAILLRPWTPAEIYQQDLVSSDWLSVLTWDTMLDWLKNLDLKSSFIQTKFKKQALNLAESNNFLSNLLTKKRSLMNL
jgi:hypothetical protein